MITKNISSLLENAKKKADESVDYFPKDGATCPVCGETNLSIVTSRPWEGDIKIRYHRCKNTDECVLAIMGTSIKSVQLNK